MKRIEYNYANCQLHEAILHLLCESFGAKYLEYYQLQLQFLASPQTTKILADEQGFPTAFIQIVEYSYRVVQGTSPLRAAYLYSVCTRKSSRGEGIMKQFIRELLDELRKENYALTFLVPAEIWLIDYYKQLGFNWVSDEIYAKAPQGVAPLIYPGREASDYLKASSRLDWAPMSQAHFEAHQREEWQLLTPPPLGWMSLPLIPKVTTYPIPRLVQPLT